MPQDSRYLIQAASLRPLLSLWLWLLCFALPSMAAEPVKPPLTDGEPAHSDSTVHWRKPPAHSRWEVAFETEAAAIVPGTTDGIQSRPQRVTVTRHGKDLLQEVLMEDGKCWETWSLGPVQFHSLRGTEAVWMSPTQPRSANPTDPTDFHSFGEFHWIRKEHFRGTFPILGRQAPVYLFPLADTSPEAISKMRTAQKGPLGALPLCEGILAAAIHPDTKHPLVLQQGRHLRFYSVSPLAQEVLLLPEKVIRFRQLLLAPARVVPRPIP